MHKHPTHEKHIKVCKLQEGANQLEKKLQEGANQLQVECNLLQVGASQIQKECNQLQEGAKGAYYYELVHKHPTHLDILVLVWFV